MDFVIFLDNTPEFPRNVIFAEKKQRMIISKTSKILDFFPNFIFCVVVVLFFGRNTMLRLPVLNEPFIEYLSGGIVLCAYYTHKLFLYPRYRLTNNLLRYFIYCLVCVLVATSVEALLVYKPIMSMLLKRSNPNIARHNFLIFCVLIYCRDFCFIILSFMTSELRVQIRMKTLFERRLRNVNGEIHIDSIVFTDNPQKISNYYSNQTTNLYDLNQTTSFYDSNQTFSNNDLNQTPQPQKSHDDNDLQDSKMIKVNNIFYFEQIKYNTIVHIISNDNIFIRACSLKKFISLVGDDKVVQISKNTVLMRQMIVKCNDAEVTIENPITHQKKVFPISEVYYSQVNEILSPDNIFTQQQIHYDAEKVTSSSVSKKPYSYQRSTSKKRKTKSVYQYIKTHKNCKAADVGEKLKISDATVNRILAQLKKEGLIEYVGSKKTGGYKVVEGLRFKV